MMIHHLIKHVYNIVSSIKNELLGFFPSKSDSLFSNMGINLK